MQLGIVLVAEVARPFTAAAPQRSDWCSKGKLAMTRALVSAPWRLLASVALALSCSPRTPPRSPELQRFLANRRGLVDNVARIRGLPDTRPTPILFDDDAA